MLKLYLTKPEVFAELKKQRGEDISFKIPGITPLERLTNKINSEYETESAVQRQLDAKKYRDEVGSTNIFKTLLKRVKGSAGSITDGGIHKDRVPPSHISLEELDKRGE